MNKIVVVCGLSAEMFAKLNAEMPEGYILQQADDVTELIVMHGICKIFCSEGKDRKFRKCMDNFYLDVGKQTGEQVIWIDAKIKPPVLEGIYFHYNSLWELLPELEMVLERARKHYTLQQMYCGAYAFLTKSGIEEMLEEEILLAWRNKYGNVCGSPMVKRVIHEWTALMEGDAITELAAVYDFSAWLKANNHPYRLSGTTVSGLIPYLLGIHEVNPLPPHLYCPECQKVIWRDDYKDGFDIPPEACPECGGLMQGDGHNLVWQEYASYGRVPSYVFYLPYDMQPLVSDWLESHWLHKFMGDQWEVAQPYEGHLVRGNLHFRFELDRDEVSPDFHKVSIDAGKKADLIHIATQGECYQGPDAYPYPKDMRQLLTQRGFQKTIYKEDEAAYSILRQNKISWRNIPACREEVFFYLKEHDFIDKDAFRGMTSVRKGKGLPVVTEAMLAAEDYWKVEYFNQIDWITSKANLLQRLFFDLKYQIKEETI